MAYKRYRTQLKCYLCCVDFFPKITAISYKVRLALHGDGGYIENAGAFFKCLNTF